MRPAGSACDIGALEVDQDMSMTAVAEPPARVFAANKFAVVSTTRNEGPEDVGATSTRFYFSTDQTRSANDVRLTGQRAVPPLAADDEFTGNASVTVPATTPAGNYFLLACADDLDVVAEHDSGNNCVSSVGQVLVVIAPDLKVSRLTNNAVRIRPGAAFSATVTTKNFGPGAAGASATQFYLSLNNRRSADDRRLAARRNVPALGNGVASTAVVSLVPPLDMPAGAFFLIACADDRRAVGERNEANNCLTSATKIAIRSAADLRVSTLTDPPANANPGDAFEVTVRTENGGNTSSTPSKTRLYLSRNRTKNDADPRLSGVVSVGSLAPGDGQTTDVSVTIPGGIGVGEFFLLACADDTRQNAEGSEANNCTASDTRVNVRR